MLSKYSFLPLLFILVSSTFAFGSEPAAALARKAVSEKSVESAAAIEELRTQGPAGLETLMTTYAAEIQEHIANPKQTSVEWQRITKALDAVSQQKNSYLSGLYWYTDLKEARRVAKVSGKPILSLRLLGKLSEELSCANSRYFRTVLYPDAAISAVLREHFVLHWQSVRPAPVITIDFGDGRKLERTITGNSIHYVLNSDGRLLEAIPGLYGPKAFLRSLNSSEALFQSLKGKNEQEARFLRRTYYEKRMKEINTAWIQDTTRIGGKLPQGFSLMTDETGTAIAIMPLAITKMYSETSMLNAMANSAERLAQFTDEDAWKKIALLHIDDARLDDRSLSLIKRQHASASEGDLWNLTHRFENLISLDSVRNEYMLRPKLYPWLLVDASSSDLEKFNDKVYKDLFLTPGSDPWLGLLVPDAYTAIDNAGVKKP